MRDIPLPSGRGSAWRVLSFPLVLRTLLLGPLHGYGIAKAIRSTSDEALEIEFGSLYPALKRLEMKGWIAAKWETSEHNRRARTYRLTAAWELRRVVERMPEGSRGARDRALLLLGFAGGLRQSELCGLDLANVRIVREGVRVRLVRSKTDQEGAGRELGGPRGGRARRAGPPRVAGGGAAGSEKALLTLFAKPSV